MSVVVKVERWNVEGHKANSKKARVTVKKVAVRDPLGRFHGVTNVRGTVLRVVY